MEIRYCKLFIQFFRHPFLELLSFVDLRIRPVCGVTCHAHADLIKLIVSVGFNHTVFDNNDRSRFQLLLNDRSGAFPEFQVQLKQ